MEVGLLGRPDLGEGGPLPRPNKGGRMRGLKRGARPVKLEGSGWEVVRKGHLKVGVLASVLAANQSSSRPCAAKVAQIQMALVV